MSGSGTIDAIDNVNDKDARPVWRISLADGPGNEAARKRLWTNRPAMFEPHVAVNLSQRRYPVCPVKVGDVISWDAGHVECGGVRFEKDGFEMDPDAPLSLA